ncbi:XTP/dITP diphosphatase [Dolosicoccus paucivorans]|uniref:XTP/dITP diphosphatase n=1 Tax=Dolosicoccus paucivorans TaxID=84521 RepID=UPI000891C2FE|nr:XTP/dITP diphosphatase [Dolosicoccus paucivorans]SDI49497.1 non-canonical purine NTP pyrophosphatase, RdgB/HAM1 family [Dolosicoccus paucivorans]
MKLIIASHNQGKLKEFKQALKDYPFEMTSLSDYPELKPVPETGETFEENARLKAETIAELTNAYVLSDDSGLVVPSLNNAPGIYSARYAGENARDEDNNDKLLRELTSDLNREAYFVSCLVLAHPHKESLVVEGRVEGEILTKRQGKEGFGYDPLFYYPPLNKTFAELTLEEKNTVSHRSRAIEKLLEELPNWLGSDEL